MYRKVLFIFCVIVGAQGNLNFNAAPCSRNDIPCITAAADKIFSVVVKGDPLMDMEILDPMHQRNIKGEFSIIKYNLNNSTVTGFRDCHVVNAKLSLEKNTMRFHLICPYFNMYGDYMVSGVLIFVPIDGQGKYSLKCKDYHLFVETETKITEDEYGKRYLQFKSFKSTADLRGGMIVGLTNLFNGTNKELADAAVKFANQYWKPVSRELQGPVVNANIKKLIKNINKYLKIVPLDDLLVY